ncbi:MAG TPA: MauE/DoxX family redox-associated membrane protein [Gemmatimonadaceae bacterium]|nr:MauE/DoxX family redox-associated membrane protein [Gemmatimonadaceae bacterium]
MLLGIRLVGVVILAAGLIKIVSSYDFKHHVADLDIIPAGLLTPAAVLAAGFEVAWGTALILNVALSFLIPASILALVVFSAVTWTGSRSGRIEDCGCYGGFISLTPAQSLAVNSVLVAILTAAWVAGVRGDLKMSNALAAAVTAGVVAAALTVANEMHEAKHGSPLIDVSPIRVGNKWNDSWSAGATAGLTGEFFVSFLGTNCPCCKSWVRVANAMSHSAQLPPVVGLVSAPQTQIATFVRDHGITFPVSRISQSLMARMTRQVPTTAVVRDGKIEQVFAGMMPVDRAADFIDAFFPKSSGTSN